MITTELMNSCRKEPKTCMQCRLTSKAMSTLHSTTKEEWVVEIIEVEEEEEQLIEAEDQSLAIDVTNKDTMKGIVTNLFIVNPMNTLLKTIQRYYEGFKRRNLNSETKMSS